MRRKIAKRLRREVLRMGGVISEEEKGKEERYYTAKVKYNGWTIYGNGEDELEVYRVVLDVMKVDCVEPWKGETNEQEN